MRLLLGLFLALGLTLPGTGEAEQSPGGRIVFASDRNGAAELFSVRSDGTGLERLTRSFPAAGEVAWARRGGRIAFSSPDDTWGPHDLWTARADGTGLRRLTRPVGQVCDSSPAWSPDGKRIAFNRSNCGFGATSIWVIGADGSNPHEIVARVGEDVARSVEWSPDGRYLAIDGDGCGIILVRPDGSGRRNLFCGRHVSGAAFSPDARRLVFATRGAPTDPNESFLYIGGIDGRGGHRIGPPLQGAYGFAWSRSGSIAFSTSGRAGEIYRIRADGTGLRRVTRNPGTSIDWSPDGGTLLYVYGEAMRLVRADGKRQRLLARFGPSTSPAWTADGRSLVFVIAHGLPEAYIANERGGSARVLLERPNGVYEPRLAPGGRLIAYVFPSNRRVEPHIAVRKFPDGPTRILAANAQSPAWSPSGKRLAYTQQNFSLDDSSPIGGSIWTVNPDSTQRRRLTREGDASSAAWSPDGRQIAFAWAEDVEKPSDLWVMDADGRNQRLLAPRGTRPAWSSDGRSLVFARGDELVVVDVTSGAESTVVRRGNLVSGPTWQPLRR